MNYKQLKKQAEEEEQTTYDKYHNATMAERIFNQAQAALPDMSAYNILVRLQMALPRLFTPKLAQGNNHES